MNGAHTRWLLVWALIFAGIVAAFQIGKAPIAIPLIRQELGLSLTFAAWIIGVYAMVGALAGLPAGAAINFIGARRCVTIGLLVIGAASCSGAFVTTGTALLVTRVLEGAGFLMVAVATPILLGLVTAAKDRDVVFGCWAVYFAAGSVIVMLAGPLLAVFGWRSLWFSTGLLALAYALVVWWIAPAPPAAAPASGQGLGDIRRIIRMPGPILLALAFGFYSIQYHALTGLLPTLLVERLGLTLASAGLISAIAIIANGIGGVSAGFMLRRGFRLWALFAAAFAFMAAAAFGIFGASMTVAGVAVLATASLGITGMLPASIYAAAPRFAPQPALLALTVGIVVQASHLGHVVGPSMLGAWVERLGWSSSPALFAAIGCGGLAVALGIRRLTRSHA
ncbi:MAG: MFS transporter [Alphaproteobacteria bacterium]|nr:MAG: MFS transporter [Alphaproteobacteria bacterium]